MNLSMIASETGPHIAIAPEAVGKIGDFIITNSMVYGVVVAIVIAVVSIMAAKRIRVKAVGGFVQLMELLFSFIIDMLEGIFDNREKAVKYAPLFGLFFLFIVINNVMGLMPWVGPGIHSVTPEGKIPLFRPLTADLNGTIALSVIAILTVQVLSIRESGWLGHLKHYFTDKPLNPINFFIGVLEVFGELTRVVSLSLRLFLNTAVGEVLISVFAFVGQNGSSFTVLPIAMFEILVALIQAYVFTVLSATYLGLAIKHHDDEHAHENSPSHPDPELTLAKELSG